MPYKTRADGTQEWVPEDDRVDSEVDRITSKDNPLMLRAAQTGKSYAARRGLINSGLAAANAQTAVLDKALPMASQNASQTAAKNLSVQGYGEAKQLADVNAGHNASLATLQGKIQEGLLSKQFELQGVRDEALHGYDMESLTTQLNSQLQQLNLQLNSSERAQATDAMLRANESYMNTIAAIAQNPDIPATERSRIETMAASYRDRSTQLVASLYSVPMTWGSGGTTTSSTRPATYKNGNPRQVTTVQRSSGLPIKSGIGQ